MANCDMCGKNDEFLVSAEIEGTILNVCRSCSRYGKIIKRPHKVNAYQKKGAFKGRPEQKKEIIQSIVQDYSKLIKDKREALGLKQKEMAIRLAERESLLQKIETGQIRPSLKLARKLEKQLSIVLVEQKEVDMDIDKKKSRSDPLTIGDMIKLK